MKVAVKCLLLSLTFASLHRMSGPTPRTWLELLRRRRGLTLTALAKATGSSLSHISMIEAGSRNPSPPMCAALAKALDTDIDELIRAFDNSPKPPPQVRSAVAS